MTEKNQPAKPLTADDVLKMAEKTSKNLDKTNASLDKTNASLDKTNASLDKTNASLDRVEVMTERNSKSIDRLNEAVDKLHKTVGSHDRKWGDLTEAITIGDVQEVFAGIDVDLTTTFRNAKCYRPDRTIELEIDGIAYSNDTVVVVEAKTDFKEGHVSNFIDKVLKRFTTLVPGHTGKKIYGVIGYLNADRRAIDLAHQRGLYVIRSLHHTKEIVTPSTDFEPYDFHP